MDQKVEYLPLPVFQNIKLRFFQYGFKDKAAVFFQFQGINSGGAVHIEPFQVKGGFSPVFHCSLDHCFMVAAAEGH